SSPLSISHLLQTLKELRKMVDRILRESSKSNGNSSEELVKATYVRLRGNFLFETLVRTFALANEDAEIGSLGISLISGIPGIAGSGSHEISGVGSGSISGNPEVRDDADMKDSKEVFIFVLFTF